jgi:hypothetical protein
MPFAGRTFFADGLQAFVGLSRDAATSGDEDMIIDQPQRVPHHPAKIDCMTHACNYHPPA